MASDRDDEKLEPEEKKPVRRDHTPEKPPWADPLLALQKAAFGDVPHNCGRGKSEKWSIKRVGDQFYPVPKKRPVWADLKEGER